MPAKFLISPSETDLAEKFGEDALTSPLPEQRGADILLYTDSGVMGWQRKQIPNDFIDSITDGRFARLLPLITKQCTFFMLINEGRFTYWPDTTVHLGMMRGGKRIPSRFTKRHIHGMLNDIELVWGVPIRWTEDLDDTVLYLNSVRAFMSKTSHAGLYTRPKVKGAWYVPTSKEIELWLLQSFPGIGPSTADAIIQHFDGEIPLQWSCSLEELTHVPRITRAKAIELWKLLPRNASMIEQISRLEASTVTTPANSSIEFESMRRKLGA